MQETFQADIICSEFIQAAQQLIDHHLNFRAVPVGALGKSINTPHTTGKP